MITLPMLIEKKIRSYFLKRVTNIDNLFTELLYKKQLKSKKVDINVYLPEFIPVILDIDFTRLEFLSNISIIRRDDDHLVATYIHDLITTILFRIDIYDDIHLPILRCYLSRNSEVTEYIFKCNLKIYLDNSPTNYNKSLSVYNYLRNLTMMTWSYWYHAPVLNYGMAATGFIVSIYITENFSSS